MNAQHESIIFYLYVISLTRHDKLAPPQEDPISLHYCIIVVLHSIYLQPKLLNVIVLSAQVHSNATVPIFTRLLIRFNPVS